MPPVRKGWVRVSKENLSYGQAKNRREILAKARKKEVFNVDKRITDKSQAVQRLKDIDQLLLPDNPALSEMDDQKREQTLTGLGIEQIWLRFKLDLIPQAYKDRSLAGILNGLEKAKPDVYDWLVARNEHGLSMLEKIRNKVFPPLYVGGYYTKR